jgi:hypothetical protein
LAPEVLEELGELCILGRPDLTAEDLVDGRGLGESSGRTLPRLVEVIFSLPTKLPADDPNPDPQSLRAEGRYRDLAGLELDPAADVERAPREPGLV